MIAAKPVHVSTSKARRDIKNLNGGVRIP